jgi:hypothetical protein
LFFCPALLKTHTVETIKTGLILWENYRFLPTTGFWEGVVKCSGNILRILK